MRTPRILLLVSLSLLFAGCAASTRVVSQKADRANTSPKRIYVQSFLLDSRAGANLGPEFAQGFSSRLIQVLQQCGAKATVKVVTGLEMDNSTFLQDLEAFKPDVILKVTKVHATVSTYGVLIKSTYALDLYDVASKNAIWRSRAEFEPTGKLYVSYERQAAAMVDKVTDQMKQDGFFPGCAKMERPTAEPSPSPSDPS